MDIKEKVIKTKKNGFVILGDNFFDSKELEKLIRLSRKAFSEKKSVNHQDYTSAKGGFEGLRFLTQYDENIHKIFNDFFSNPFIEEFLKSILGSNYKIWTINYRLSRNTDKGLSFHQDSYGETNLAILLKNNFTGQGTTTFIPGSHLIKPSLKKNNIGIPLFFNSILKPFAKILTGREGQVGLFFNKTWHARTANFSGENYDAILISLFPQGTSYGSSESGQWSSDYLEAHKDSDLMKLIDPNINTKKINDYTFEVVGENEESYSKNLYDMKVNERNYNYYVAFFLFYLLFFISLFLNPIKKLLKK